MKAILFLSLFYSNAFASDFTKQIWSKGNDHYLFNLHGPSNILISENCFNEDTSLEKSTCEAAKILKQQKKTLVVPADSFSGGKNPGAVACGIGLKKQVLVLKDSKNNENSFCVFDDQSMISAINLQMLLKD
jgi:hypothetical protein